MRVFYSMEDVWKSFVMDELVKNVTYSLFNRIKGKEGI